MISFFKICTYTSSCVPPSTPTNRHSPRMKGETYMSHGRVNSSPRDPGVTGAAQEALSLDWSPTGTHTRVQTTAPCPRGSSLRSHWPQCLLAPGQPEPLNSQSSCTTSSGGGTWATAPKGHRARALFLKSLKGEFYILLNNGDLLALQLT